MSPSANAARITHKDSTRCTLSLTNGQTRLAAPIPPPPHRGQLTTDQSTRLDDCPEPEDPDTSPRYRRAPSARPACQKRAANTTGVSGIARTSPTNTGLRNWLHGPPIRDCRSLQGGIRRNRIRRVTTISLIVAKDARSASALCPFSMDMAVLSAIMAVPGIGVFSLRSWQHEGAVGM